MLPICDRCMQHLWMNAVTTYCRACLVLLLPLMCFPGTCFMWYSAVFTFQTSSPAQQPEVGRRLENLVIEEQRNGFPTSPSSTSSGPVPACQYKRFLPCPLLAVAVCYFVHVLPSNFTWCPREKKASIQNSSNISDQPSTWPRFQIWIGWMNCCVDFADACSTNLAFKWLLCKRPPT